jgi:hypothetical protein
MRRQIKQVAALLVSASLGAALFGAAPAGAAVSLAVGPVSHALLAPNLTDSAQPVHRGDEYFTYSVTVTNNGDTATTVPTNLSLSLPAGVVLDGIVPNTSSGWSCFLSANTCTYGGAAILAGASFPVLKIGVLLDPALSPQVLNASFAAFGGGAASGANNSHAFEQAAALQFGFTSVGASACGEAPVLTPPTTAACQSAGAGDPATQAGGHPFVANVTFDFQRKKARPEFLSVPKADEGERPFESLRDGAVNLPPGFVANPTVIPGGCTLEQISGAACPTRFAVGRAWAHLKGALDDQESAVFKIEAEPGYPARFAFKPLAASPVTIVLRPKVRPGDGTVTALIPTAPQAPLLMGIRYFAFCSYGAKVKNVAGVNGTAQRSEGCKKATDPGALGIPFLTNPTRCNGEEDVTRIDVTSYQNPGRVDSEGFPDLGDSNWKSYETKSPPLTGCNQLPFEPSFEGRPTTDVADAPSGLDFHLRIPQDGLLEPEGIATAHLRQATVKLPVGMTLNPAAANGLEACSVEQMGLLELNHPGPFPVRFDGQEARCPNGSKIGSVEVTSPVIDETVKGGVYLAEQDDPATTTPGAENPFDSTLALYIAVRNDAIGVSAKLAGEVEADPVTGQLTTTFNQNPQLPFDHLRLKITEGARGSLRTPPTCGSKTTTSEMLSWSTQTPAATPSDTFAVTQDPDGGACPANAAEIPNAPRLSAGTTNAKAGAYSPFVLRISRDDGTQELKGINTTLPPGLTGRLAGVQYCPEPLIAQAIARDNPREGALEQARPSCPASSLLGSVDVAAGAGPHPYHATGRAYLAGPYKGAPVSMVVITPAVAGPFDLGTVVIRNALYIDSKTTQVSVKSDPLPTILEGIPLDVRSIEVKIDRNQFTLNPTSCEPMSIGATALGLSSDAGLSTPFQASECAALGFKPGLHLKLRGKTRRGAYQQLTATVTYPEGAYANIARASVALPHSAFLAQEHIGTVCTRVQFAAHACPDASIYGTAKAITPLLDEPLQGTVYLRSSNNPLPDLVVLLKGPNYQPVEVELAGRTDSVHGGIRNTFDIVPDAPVKKFTLSLFGGGKSLIVNSRNLCKGKPQRATARFTAQNGRQYSFRPLVRNDCGKKGKKGGAKSKRASRAR